MNTQCTGMQLEFQGVGRRKVQGAFDGGHVTSDGGVLLLREMDERLGLTKRVAQCFTDHRDPELIEHSVEAFVAQRIYGIALGKEDVEGQRRQGKRAGFSQYAQSRGINPHISPAFYCVPLSYVISGTLLAR